MTRSVLNTVIVASLIAAGYVTAGAQQDRIGADATTTPVGVHTQAGRRVSYLCPAIRAAELASAEVWGSDLYVSDSPVCIAAIHAGVLPVERAGVVTILLSSGADRFTGSARNGVTTKDYGPNATSYSFDKTGAAGQIDWSTKAIGIPPTFTAPILVACPGGGAMTFQIWGSDVYHDESSICVAAVHAGLITRANGGSFFLRGDNGKNTYPSVDRNGVTSTFWSGDAPSFRVSATQNAQTVADQSSPSTSTIREPIATPKVVTAVCSPTVTKPGGAPNWVAAGATVVSPLGADIRWQAVAAAVGYVIERAPASGGTSTKLATTCDQPDAFTSAKDANNVDVMSYKDRSGGIQQQTDYVYLVRAFGNDGQMGWNSAHWASPTLPFVRLTSVDQKGSTVTLHWSLDDHDPMKKTPVFPPNEFLVKSEYGYSAVLPRSQFGSTCGCSQTILGVPLGAHTFTVEARWAPDTKSSDTKSVTIAP